MYLFIRIIPYALHIIIALDVVAESLRALVQTWFKYRCNGIVWAIVFETQIKRSI